MSPSFLYIWAHSSISAATQNKSNILHKQLFAEFLKSSALPLEITFIKQQIQTLTLIYCTGYFNPFPYEFLLKACFLQIKVLNILQSLLHGMKNVMRQFVGIKINLVEFEFLK